MRQRHRPGGPQPNGVETPPSRGPWSRREAVEKILEAIPDDRWVSAAQIAAETGILVRRISALIGSRLLIAYVERRLTGPSRCSIYLYRRLRRVDASRRTSDS